MKEIAQSERAAASTAVDDAARLLDVLGLDVRAAP